MTTQLRRSPEICLQFIKPYLQFRPLEIRFFSCITKPLATQDALTMKFLSFFLFSLWYALGGAFCIEVVGIFGVVRYLCWSCSESDAKFSCQTTSHLVQPMLLVKRTIEKDQKGTLMFLSKRTSKRTRKGPRKGHREQA